MYNTKYHEENGAVQYIMELICKRKAKKDGILLEKRFWTDPVWQKFYKEQIVAAKKLLNMYDEKAVVKTIEDNYYWSLRPKFVSEKILEQVALADKKKKQEQAAFERQETVLTEEQPVLETRQRWRK